MFTHMQAHVCPGGDKGRPFRPQKGVHCQGVIFQERDVALSPGTATTEPVLSLELASRDD